MPQSGDFEGFSPAVKVGARGVAVVIEGRSVVGPMPHMTADVDVLFLGAGISGLAMAFWLKERGATVEMLRPRAARVA